MTGSGIDERKTDVQHPRYDQIWANSNNVGPRALHGTPHSGQNELGQTNNRILQPYTGYHNQADGSTPVTTPRDDVSDISCLMESGQPHAMPMNQNQRSNTLQNSHNFRVCPSTSEQDYERKYQHSNVSKRGTFPPLPEPVSKRHSDNSLRTYRCRRILSEEEFTIFDNNRQDFGTKRGGVLPSSRSPMSPLQITPPTQPLTSPNQRRTTQNSIGVPLSSNLKPSPSSISSPFNCRLLSHEWKNAAFQRERRRLADENAHANVNTPPIHFPNTENANNASLNLENTLRQSYNGYYTYPSLTTASEHSFSYDYSFDSREESYQISDVTSEYGPIDSIHDQLDTSFFSEYNSNEYVEDFRFKNKLENVLTEARQAMTRRKLLNDIYQDLRDIPVFDRRKRPHSRRHLPRSNTSSDETSSTITETTEKSYLTNKTVKSDETSSTITETSEKSYPTNITVTDCTSESMNESCHSEDTVENRLSISETVVISCDPYTHGDTFKETSPIHSEHKNNLVKVPIRNKVLDLISENKNSRQNKCTLPVHSRDQTVSERTRNCVETSISTAHANDNPISIHPKSSYTKSDQEIHPYNFTMNMHNYDITMGESTEKQHNINSLETQVKNRIKTKNNTYITDAYSQDVAMSNIESVDGVVTCGVEVDEEEDDEYGNNPRTFEMRNMKKQNYKLIRDSTDFGNRQSTCSDINVIYKPRPCEIEDDLGYDDFEEVYPEHLNEYDMTVVLKLEEDANVGLTTSANEDIIICPLINDHESYSINNETDVNEKDNSDILSMLYNVRPIEELAACELTEHSSLTHLSGDNLAVENSIGSVGDTSVPQSQTNHHIDIPLDLSEKCVTIGCDRVSGTALSGDHMNMYKRRPEVPDSSRFQTTEPTEDPNPYKLFSRGYHCMHPNNKYIPRCTPQLTTDTGADVSTMLYKLKGSDRHSRDSEIPEPVNNSHVHHDTSDSHGNTTNVNCNVSTENNHVIHLPINSLHNVDASVLTSDANLVVVPDTFSEHVNPSKINIDWPLVELTGNRDMFSTRTFAFKEFPLSNVLRKLVTVQGDCFPRLFGVSGVTTRYYLEYVRPLSQYASLPNLTSNAPIPSGLDKPPVFELQMNHGHRGHSRTLSDATGQQETTVRLTRRTRHASDTALVTVSSTTASTIFKYLCDIMTRPGY